MARKKKTDSPQGKLRTRSHIIADMAVLHVQTLAVLCGFTAQRSESNYGYDLNLYTYNEKGEAENDALQLQVKASDDLQTYALVREHVFSFTVSKRDYQLWCNASFPVFLILYDAQLREAYWLDIHLHAKQVSETKERYIRLRVPRNNVLGAGTTIHMRHRKLDIIEELQRSKQRKKNDE